MPSGACVAVARADECRSGKLV